jgi:pimeloyl-ACP methyl ester carboxylesterase
MHAYSATSCSATILQRSNDDFRNAIRRVNPAILLAILVLALAAMMSPDRCVAQPSQQAPQVGRPILFVHGFCADASDWGALRNSVISSTTGVAPTLYTDSTNYTVYYDPTAQRVKLWPSGNDLLTSNVTPAARFFSINFMDPGSLQDPSHFSASDVTDVSILNKGNELAQVIGAITTLTRVKDVVVIAHSMGGLDTRAYLENLAAPSLSICYDSDLYHSCARGGTKYTHDIDRLVTIDTPHGGAVSANYISGINGPPSAFEGCILEDSLNRRELEETSLLVGLIRLEASSLEPQLTIASIQSYLDPGSISEPDDGIVTKTEQSFGQSLKSVVTTAAANYDLDNQFPGLLGPWIGPPVNCIESLTLPLHLLGCVGTQPSTQALVNSEISKSLASPAQTTSITVQATLDGNPWPPVGNTGNVNYEISGPTGFDVGTVPSTFYDIPVGLYALAYIGGGPSNNLQILPNQQFLVVNHDTGANTWNITFTLAFSSVHPSFPAATTASATGLAGDGATLNGTVNPNGSATNAWFEWGTSSTLTNFSSTSAQSIGSGAVDQPVAADLSGLVANGTYFYRMAAGNAAGTNRGPILSFTTLGTLSKPILQSPGNGTSGISTSPNLSWSAVANATSYRLIIATTPSALPLDATSATCGVGCVLNNTPQSNSFQMPAGILTPGSTYYWEVHGRSPSQFGDWSAISSFAVGTPVANDFSVQTSPASQTVSIDGSVGYSISTATTSGSPQTITLSAVNLPTGVSVIFTPNILTSGQSAILGISTSSTTPAGSYTLTILASGSSTTHTANVQLVVNGTIGAPAVTFSPTSLSFPDQTLFTNSTSQLVNFINTGTAPLQVLSIVGDNNFAVVNPCINTLPPGTRCTFSVLFDPSKTGPLDGQVQLLFVGPASPAILTVRGTGLAPAPTSGTIQVNGTLNGAPLPNTQQFSYPFSYSLSGPDALSGGGAAAFTADPGTYTISFSGSPSTFTLASVTPSATQTVSAGSVTTFTLNFTAPNDFSAPFFFFPISQVVKTGSSATYTAGIGNPPPGNALTPITLQVTGIPAGSGANFNPAQAGVAGNPVLTVSTDPGLTPPGAYTLQLTGANSSGLVRPGSNTASLVVTKPPATPVQLISQDSGGVQANASSTSSTNNAASADGRFVVFGSGASNLPGDANGSGQAYVRDRQTGTTTLVSVNNGGVPANSAPFGLTISADGRYVAFASGASNLPQAPTDGSNAIYVRDLQLAQTERVDVSADTVSNGVSFLPSISADGRFVAFVSTATNLAPEATSPTLQIFVRDRVAGLTSIASLGIDGLEGNGRASAPTISADGRYVTFFDNATNLTATQTGGSNQVYVRDMQSAQTILASLGSDGLPANGTIFGNGNAPGISADGRFVVFTSNATNLVPGAIDANGDLRVFERDVTGQTTRLVDVDASGVPLAQGGINPTISADGRFVTYQIYNQTLVRDMNTNQSVDVSLAPDGTAQNSTSSNQGDPPSISYNGNTVVFTSSATNLIAGDSNAASDVFAAQNPLLGTPYATSITLDASSTNGGTSVGGTVVLSGPAPASGATVALSSNNVAAAAPAVLFVAPGATSARFTLDTSVVPKETLLTILASYNSGAAASVLAVQPAPNLEITPNGWDFGPQTVGISSATNTFTVGNSGTLPLTVNSVGLATGQVFNITANTCGLTLPAGSSCSVSVVFDPASAGPASDFLQVSFGSPAATKSVQMLGTGGVPNIMLSSETIDFGTQPLSSNTQKTVSVTNLGNAALTGILASVTGVNSSDFSIVGDDCSNTSLSPNTSCLITLAFVPSAAGSRAASLTLSSNAAGSPKTANLIGIGAAPAVNLSTTAISFSNQPVGTSSAAQAITVQNTGTALLPITSVALGGGNTGDFSQTNTCGANLPAGTSCVVNVTFAPVTIGSKSASVILTDSLGSQSVTLAGTGTGALAILSPSSLSFPNQLVGTPSTAQSLTLSNSGNVALNVTSISVTGANSSDFAQTNNCRAGVAAGSSCTINVTFTPSGAGSRNATITVVDDTGTQNAAVNGIGTAPVVSLSASNITFAAQAIGTTSPTQAVTLSNSGNGALAISSLSVTGANAADFAQTNTCGTGVAAGSTCTININFTPTATGSRTAFITISDNAGAQNIALSGTGLINGPAVQLNPTSLSFGIQAVGTTSSARTINVTNVGNVALSITSISVTGTNRANFVQTNTCGTSVAVGAACTVSVTFTPSAAGPRTAAVTLKGGAGTQTVTLDGTGQAALGVSPTSIAFGNQALGSMGTTHTVTISNNTGVLVNIAAIAVNGTNPGDFQQTSSTCGPTLAFNSSCTINLVFAPSALGARTATLTIVDDATNSPQAVALSGTGIVPVAVTPASLAFAGRAVGTTSASKNVTIKNNLPTILTISSIVFGGANPSDFTQSATTCGTTLAAGANCTVSIVFAPTAVGSRSAVLNITDGAITSPQSVALTGAGK